VFSSFEKEYARTLSPTEYELINEWLKIYSEEMINLALKEAVYNGVSNLKYIDKILYNWGKKGLTTKEKIENDSVKYKNKKSDVNIVDYDWLGVKN
jgi:DNA replication protein